MSWFSDQRQAWIAETLHIFGFINRLHLMRKFHISNAQAALDIAAFTKSNPNAMTYDPKRRAYFGEHIKDDT